MTGQLFGVGPDRCGVDLELHAGLCRVAIDHRDGPAELVEATVVGAGDFRADKADRRGVGDGELELPTRYFCGRRAVTELKEQSINTVVLDGLQLGHRNLDELYEAIAPAFIDPNDAMIIIINT